ncbi:MAG: heparinase II/III family protein [Victivallaceae bacterium]
MKRFYWIMLLPLVLAAAGPLPDWDRELRPDHPRLLINRDELPAIRRAAAGANHAEYAKLRAFVEKFGPTGELRFRNDRFKLKADGKAKLAPGVNQGPEIVENPGMKEAAAAAMLYLISGEAADRDRALALLDHAECYLRFCLEADVPADYHTEHFLNFMCACDWLYNDLDPERRRAIGGRIAEYVREMQPEGRMKVFKATGAPNTGFYGTLGLLFPAGIVLAGTGVDDALARKFLDSGYALATEAMTYRDRIAGEQGLLVAGTATYSFGAYPLATFLYFYENRAALNRDATLAHPHMKNFLNWFLWATIPDGKGRFYHYGYGDVDHRDNRFDHSHLYGHFAQIADFYRQSAPEATDRALALIATLPEELRCFNDWYPFMPLLLTGFDSGKRPAADIAELAGRDTGCYFPVFGLAFMRSAYRPDATFAMFRSGSTVDLHQHYDENSFVIYRNGFLALDTGNRGMASHHVYYYPQSVAHNTILIDQPGEKMPPHWYHWPWGERAKFLLNPPPGNDGGQCNRTSGICREFKTSGEYTFVRGDATGNYLADKCKLAVRDFIFLPPYDFVIFDRVESVRPEAAKRFVLHPAGRPEALDDGWFKAANGTGGELRWITLLPRDPKREVIGGPDHEFFTAGRNFPLASREKAFASPNFYGAWRQEVTARENEAKTCFLHILQAAAPGEPRTEVELVEAADKFTVKLKSAGGRRSEVVFERDGFAQPVVRRDGQ